ncbi:AfsR/SARP family transcriptional regulator [Virgisporangium ochraceum]|uniref:SARP family transcriptional regulator n=1 Tax=Virgisporangium ochraceum TaxID=65505 RepID=A0A8J4A148_9ACTN|nr:AfsR/SARP family transcriptional regulator [Virgisporangium ochraceum]GIJ71285.1 SARP family transcriptional regulator [Virgisporangium ochraceum]
MAVRFSLLGPVRVTVEGVALAGIAPRHRAVLAHLLLNAGRVISMEKLIDAVWGVDRPETARSQVHAAITALRRALRAAGVEGVVETRPGGYVAVPGPGRLDVQEFTDLVTAGRFRDALDLWHGDALADVTAHYAPAARALLEDRRLAAVERLMQAEVDAGRHAAVLDELAGHVAAHPLRERLVGLLMVALHRGGRQADALAAARSYRTTLAEEQGLDPGQAFLDLERTVLTEAAGPEPAAASSFLPYDLPDFTGRATELDRLLTGHPIVTIDGMAGIGKTTLAVHAAHRLADRFPDGRLFVDLRANTPGLDPLPAAAALETLLRQLGVTDIPTTEAERSARWRTELARRRVVAVLDNAADGAHVRPLISADGAGSLLLVTSRRRLVDLDGAHALSVDVLPHDDAAALFDGIVGARAADDPAAVRDVLERCGYLPLAIRICAARLQHRPRWSVADLAGRLRLAQLATSERSVAAAFTVSYEQLTADEQRMFRLLGLAPGRDIEPDAAAALAGVSPLEAEDLLESLLDAHMVVQHEPRRYALHDLLREHARTLATDDDAPMRLLVHYLHRSRSAVNVLFPHSVPQPELPAPDPPVRAITDPVEAVGWLDAERGNIIETVTHGPRICVGLLATALRPYLDRQAHHDDALTLHTTALHRSRALGDPVVEGRALADLAWTHWRRGDYRQAEEFAREALAILEDGHARSLALNALGNVAWRRRDSAAAERCLKEALDLTRIAGDRSREGFVLGDLGMILDQLDRHDEARRHLDLALALHRREGNPLGEARVQNQLGSVLRHQGRAEEAVDRHRRAAGLYRSMGNSSDESSALNGLGEALLALGDADGAVRRFAEALDLAETAGNRPERARAHDGLARASHDDRHADAAARLYADLGVPSLLENSTTASASVAAAQAHSTANPAHGGSG